MKKGKHGLHRPGRCCIQCYREASADYPIAFLKAGLYTPPEAAWDAMDTEPQPYTGHPIIPPGSRPGHDVGNPDKGVLRTVAARIQTSENAGDRW